MKVGRGKTVYTINPLVPAASEDDSNTEMVDFTTNMSASGGALSPPAFEDVKVVKNPTSPIVMDPWKRAVVQIIITGIYIGGTRLL